MNRSISTAALAAAALLAWTGAGYAAPPPDKPVLLPTAVGRPAADLVMLVDNGPVVPSQGFPGLTYISFARVNADGTMAGGPFVVPAGKVLVLTSASGGQSGPANGLNTLTLYAWVQPDGAVRGLYGNNFRIDAFGAGDIRIDFGSGFALAAGHALLATAPIANIGLNFQGYLADQ